jgi:DNA repair protein RecN (Recombination protein N)
VIEELRIADLGVIGEATMTPHPGLTVVTGETGAGKTMIVSGLGLLLGVRADPMLVRRGAERARVEGRFTGLDLSVVERVTELGGQSDDGDLLIARHLTAAGRSRAYLGGAQVPAGVCAEVADRLVTLHGQAEQVQLGRSDRQREILDRFAGDAVASDLADYRVRYAARRTTQAELDQLRTDAASRAREIDMLRFGLEEIGRADPQPGEDVALRAEAQRLQSADDLRAAAAAALRALTGDEDEPGGALTGLAMARRAVEGVAAADPELDRVAARVAEAGYLVTDLSGDLATYLAGLDGEPGRLEWIAERRFALAGLTRKYGATCDEVLAWAGSAVARLDGLAGSDDRVAKLAVALARLEAELTTLASRLSRARRAAAEEFARRVQPELVALAMPHAALAFSLTGSEQGPYGADLVDLLFTANPGTEPRSLAKVASGGELSRVRLALEVVLAAEHATGTFVFDEVDAGVGGKVAVEIGRRLAVLARRAQVIVVTHLAQVAAFADRHYVVVKSDDGQVTTSGVQEITDDNRAAELARMMAGLETSESALAHAGELVELAAAARAPGGP